MENHSAGNRKREILEAALSAFSVNGYEATGLSELADAVGIRKASLYSHFTGKRDILETLLKEMNDRYEERSLFANADKLPERIAAQTPEELENTIREQLLLILHDPDISRVRRLLTIEQFRDPALARLHTRMSYENVLDYNTRLMKAFIALGVLRDEDPVIMAAQFAWPISKWVELCDREPERESEIAVLISRHIRQFMRLYGRE